MVRETDAYGAVTAYVYGEVRGKPFTVRHASGEEIRYKYDNTGCQMALEDDCDRGMRINARNFRTMVWTGKGIS